MFFLSSYLGQRSCILYFVCVKYFNKYFPLYIFKGIIKIRQIIIKSLKIRENNIEKQRINTFNSL